MRYGNGLKHCPPYPNRHTRYNGVYWFNTTTKHHLDTLMSNKDVTLEKAGQTDTSWWPDFCMSLRKMPNISKACRAAGVARQTAYRHRDEYPEFAAMWEDALEEGLDGWEAEMARRAYEGMERPLMYQGDIVGHVNEYSDTLAIFLMKAHRPEKYRERSEVKTDGNLTINVKYEEE